jgi:hypothetical protein
MFLNLAGIIYFSKDIYLKQNPIVIESSDININPEYRVIKPEDFRFLFAVNDPTNYQTYVNESIYTLGVYRTIITNGKLDKYEPVSTELCTREHFKNLPVDTFSSDFPFSSYYCIAQNETIALQGLTSSANLEYFKIMVKKCNNATSASICATPEELDFFLDATTISIYHIDKFMNPTIYDNPIKPYLKNYWTRASKKSYMGILFNFKVISFMDDIGVLFQNIDEKQEIKVENISTFTEVLKTEHFIEIIFMYTQDKTIISRRYKRLQQVIAEIGGLLNGISLVFSFIVKRITQKLYMNQIMEKMCPSKSKKKNVDVSNMRVLNENSSNSASIIPNNYLNIKQSADSRIKRNKI